MQCAKSHLVIFSMQGLNEAVLDVLSSFHFLGHFSPFWHGSRDSFSKNNAYHLFIFIMYVDVLSNIEEIYFFLNISNIVLPTQINIPLRI